MSEASADFWKRVADSDLLYSFRRSPGAIIAAVVTLGLGLAALLAPWIAPHDPFDPAGLSILDNFLPPAWEEGGDARFLLGTDDQGRDLLSAMLYGLRISLAVGFASVILAMIVGVWLGLIAGYVGGFADVIIMRVADVQMTFPAILIALLLAGIFRGTAGPGSSDSATMMLLIISISLSFWVQYARTVRGSVLVQASKEYVEAARLIGVSSIGIMVRHILPNVLAPVLVIATINLALAIIIEATLSFLGVGVPSGRPSLGTLIRIGNDYLFSGEWWITLFPGVLLGVLALSVNLFGDWLRDALNPKLA
ncbi:MAG: ABC transporter permease [Phyllobacteriaceae bacterium]|nr:ABC transporter permease [Phyllobacteriaceae bacterium]